MTPKAKQWKPTKAPDPELVLNLQQSIGIKKHLAYLMAQRGITTYQEAEQYFNPSIEQLHDPFLMMDMAKAVNRIMQAIEANESILFYGDYDVDGTTSVALMMLFFGAFYPNIHFYVPDRKTEGYGISLKGIDFAADNGFSLVVALDCGIKAVDAMNYANEKELDFIICDHHNPGDELPNAHAVLDPKRIDCIYPYKELSGCGVGFKLLQALKVKKNEWPDPFQFIDLLAVSIASDIVPLTGENRVLAFEGLRKLNTKPSAGLATMMKHTGFNGPYTINDVVFKLGPRINAAGRLKHAQYAVELLIGQKGIETEELSAQINRINQDRRNIERSITAECISMLSDLPTENKTVVLYDNDWHKGVIGIVASKIVEEVYKPAIVLTKTSDTYATGSARSVEGFNLYEALVKCDSFLEQYGGHKAAAGMTIALDKIGEFKNAFEKAVTDLITPEQQIPKLYYDVELIPADISMSLYKTIHRLGPFGPDNHRPRFMLRNVHLRNAQALGSDLSHLRFTVFNGKQQIKGIAFGKGQFIEMASAGHKFDLCFCLEINEWQGNRSLQLDVKDLKLAEE
ncbi:MAG: single-stranded-DNA-specific exonuclease RecJ [Bacteroidetes bacterium]|nr:single-stranded-DNA-specific exonuclease RecJ [Bacteroidota bacterium]